MRELLLVGAGGALGSAARYLLHLWLPASTPPAFPWATFSANVGGCLIIGLLFGLSEDMHWPGPATRLFLMTGICGGFTTFSTFALENFRLWNNSQYPVAILYTTATLIAAYAATAAGYVLVKTFR